MNQDNVFRELEGDAWFKRNKDVIINAGIPDYPSYLINLIENKNDIASVLEIGCSNGFRLESLRNNDCGSKFVGVDCSLEALEDGRKRYPQVHFHRGVLTDLPLEEQFDLVIVNLVLCWVGRVSLAKSVAEIDRITKDGGFLVIGDHFPDYPHRRRYHHYLEEEVYTYKQNYGSIFEALGTYKELARITYNLDQPECCVQVADNSKRAVCMLFRKSLADYYPEV